MDQRLNGCLLVACLETVGGEAWLQMSVPSDVFEGFFVPPLSSWIRSCREDPLR
jgi:hypothetical protein